MFIMTNLELPIVVVEDNVIKSTQTCKCLF